MLVEIVQKKETKQQLEIKLPFHSKSYDTFYRIESDKKVIVVTRNYIAHWDMGSKIAEAASEKEITDTEFFAAYLSTKADLDIDINPSWAGAKTASDND